MFNKNKLLQYGYFAFLQAVSVLKKIDTKKAHSEHALAVWLFAAL